ncbi:Bromodomain-containing protein-like protein [Amylocarpus encephaloides]|uniref:Bromodomain-containing protein-like protein n=1 Tax=Amylocarpus encephaloides TaxID=45428 RepID=A0A9P8C160_9HELO|nr:Bromodomain-containing protein-like protein [Amylocarpus encephaloides]
MESKRKVNGGAAAAGEDLDDRAAKRRKVPGDSIDVSQEETPETTSQQGLKLVETLKKTEDKSGRVISTSFLTLPNKRQFPNYYKSIRMPIALDTIQEKLGRREFKNLTELESFFKRMIANAKEFNQKGSEVYDDAERLRKALSNYMTKTNPAYKLIPGYVAVPTPFPTEPVEAPGDMEDAEGELDSEVEAVPVSVAKKVRGRAKLPAKSQPSRKSIPPAIKGRDGGLAFSKLNFQQAQEKILENLIMEKEQSDDEYGTFEVFVDLPDRDLKDYYKVIKTPASLGTVQKQVKPDDGVSEFKTWAAFEKAMDSIWNNAWQYNEDGSQISELAKDLQKRFNKLYREARHAVQEPAAPKIKLKMPDPAPKITLKFGGKGGSPAGSPAPQTNGSNGVATNGTRRNPFGGSSLNATTGPSVDRLERARSASGSAPSPTPSNAAVVKNEEAARASPAIPAGYSNYRGGSQAVSTPGLSGSGMPPPSTPGATPNNMYSASGYAQSFQHPQQAQYQPQQPSSMGHKWREPGKDAADAMITNLNLATHPGLNIARHFRMDLPPSPTMAQQSITINLPHTHYYLQIKPTIASSVFDRQYRLFVTAGASRLHALPSTPGHPMDQRQPLFEARLLPGVNRIEIELIAALPKGTVKPSNGPEVELEKVAIFANLLKDQQPR